MAANKQAKILVTGFDPFGAENINPSWLAVEQLPAKIAGYEVIKAQVPTVFGDSSKIVTDLIGQHQPELIICVGQAAGRAEITAERIAINIDDARIPDNAGKQPIDQQIAPGQAAAYFSTLPIKAMVAAARQAGVPAALSNSAGTFVCNHLMYSVLHQLATLGNSRARAGFVHVPALPQQFITEKTMPTMQLTQIVAGLAAMIAAAATTETDLKTIEGAIS